MIRLYYSPGACSLASRIAIHEAGLDAEFELVDLRTRTTESGADFEAVNPKGCVPAISLDDGATITENIAILGYLAELEPRLGCEGPLNRTRLLEMLSFLSTELHIAFRPFYRSSDPAAREAAALAVAGKLDFVADHVRELYLFGPHFTVADAYLFAMLRWAREFGIPMRPHLQGYFNRVTERATVRRALAEEGLPIPALAEQPVVQVA